MSTNNLYFSSNIRTYSVTTSFVPWPPALSRYKKIGCSKSLDEERNRRLRREDGPISYEYAVEEEEDS